MRSSAVTRSLTHSPSPHPSPSSIPAPWRERRVPSARRWRRPARGGRAWPSLRLLRGGRNGYQKNQTAASSWAAGKVLRNAEQEVLRRRRHPPARLPPCPSSSSSSSSSIHAALWKGGGLLLLVTPRARLWQGREARKACSSGRFCFCNDLLKVRN